MGKLQLFIRTRGSIAYLVLLQAGLWLIAFLLQFAGINLALPSDFNMILQQPWTIITFPLLSIPSILFVVFDLMWLYGIGFLLRDYRSDKFILYLYFISVYASAAVLLIASKIFGFPMIYVYGAPIGNLAILVATARLIPNLKIPLFLFGNIPLKWIVAVYVVLQTLSIGRYGLLMIVVSLLVGLFVVNIPYYNFSFEFNKNKPVSFTEEEIDNILEKISKYGYDKLSRKEKRILEEYSKRQK